MAIDSYINRGGVRSSDSPFYILLFCFSKKVKLLKKECSPLGAIFFPLRIDVIPSREETSVKLFKAH